VYHTPSPAPRRSRLPSTRQSVMRPAVLLHIQRGTRYWSFPPRSLCHLFRTFTSPFSTFMFFSPDYPEPSLGSTPILHPLSHDPLTPLPLFHTTSTPLCLPLLINAVGRRNTPGPSRGMGRSGIPPFFVFRNTRVFPLSHFLLSTPDPRLPGPFQFFL